MLNKQLFKLMFEIINSSRLYLIGSIDGAIRPVHSPALKALKWPYSGHLRTTNYDGAAKQPLLYRRSIGPVRAYIAPY